MSQAEQADIPPRPRNYKPGTGRDRYARFAADWLNVERTYVLDTVLSALEEHQQVVAIGGNGVGKSFFVGVGGLAGLYCNRNTIVHVTAGTSTTLKNNIWKPTRGMFKDAKEKYGLPGRKLDGTREIQTEIAEKWYFECISPRYPDDLEGPHNDNVIYFIEEADKPGVTADHIDSVRSTVTDKDDRVCIIANPPTDEGNVVHELIESDEWLTLTFPSWDSHNVRIERGLEDGEEIGGLATSWKIRQDWDEYHDEPWPGLEQAIRWSDPGYGTGQTFAIPPDDPPNEEFRDDLHERWYKRRAGLVPAQSSETWRPFTVSDVRAGSSKPYFGQSDSPIGVGIDVARKGGDSTVVATLYDTHITATQWNDSDHNDNETKIREHLDELHPTPPIAIDAVGEGSALADSLSDRYSSLHRFKAGQRAVDDDEYYNRWTEGLAHLGKRTAVTAFEDADLREQLFAAARSVKFEVNQLRSGDVLKATPKSEIKERLGESPDVLDAYLMAVWAADVDLNPEPESIPSTW